MAGEIIPISDRIVAKIPLPRYVQTLVQELGLLGHRVYIVARDVDAVYPGALELRATGDNFRQVRCGRCSTHYRETSGRCPECGEAEQLDTAYAETAAEIRRLEGELRQERESRAVSPHNVNQLEQQLTGERVRLEQLAREIGS